MITRQAFTIYLCLLCLAYAVMMFFYNDYAMISVDEFWFAHRIYEFKSGMPYRDFAPYKTVLGYYLLLPGMLFTQGVFSTLITLKNFIALINVFFIFVCSRFLSKFFSPSAILISLLVLLCSDLVLNYSSNIRVDLVGYWFCFAAVLLLMDKRYLLAGLLMGLGFCTTQKAVWYIAAANMALLMNWVLFERDRRSVMQVVSFNIVCLSVIAVYMALWATFSSWSVVYHSIFTEASILYHLASYESSRKLYWSMIAFYNPLLFLLWPICLLSVFVREANKEEYRQRVFAVVFATCIFLFLVPYKQVFPYYMQVTIPVFLLLYSAFFSWCFSIFSSQPSALLVGRTGLALLSLLCGLFVVISVFTLHLPAGYLFVCLPSLMLVLYLSRQTPVARQLFFLSLVAVGGVYAPILSIVKIHQLNGEYQKLNIKALNALLASDGDYLAGIELIYNKTQPIAGMRHLGVDAIHYLYAPTTDTRAMMLASLYADPNASIDTVIRDLSHAPVKLYVNNYRMVAIPPAIKQYLDTHYEHYWGSLYLYAPLVRKGAQTVDIKFSSRYQLQSTTHQTIVINHRRYHDKDAVFLKNGKYTSQASEDYRLKMLPELALQLPPSFQQDEWGRILY